MKKPDPAATVAGELKLLFRCYPEVSLANLAEALHSHEAASPSASPPPGAAWDTMVEPVLRCAAAFGDSRLFASKREALAILAEELGVPSSWTNLTWSQLPSIAAAALLRHGPGKAQEIAQRYQFPPGGSSPSRRSSKVDETVAATIGIINAKHT